MKAIVQGIRFEVFSIIDSLMAFHRNGTQLAHISAPQLN
jgi:hypothetical protein